MPTLLQMAALIVMSGTMGCEGEEASNGAGTSSVATPLQWTLDEPESAYEIGYQALELFGESERPLRAQVWYPAAEAATALELQDLAWSSEEAELIADALQDDEAGPGCGRRVQSATLNAPPRGQSPWPTILYSHCFECTSYSAANLAETLAGAGFAVVAVEHAGNTLFDSGALLSDDFLQVRTEDMRRVTNLVLGQNAPIPAELQGRFDEERLAVVGHSFGAATAGMVLSNDERFSVGVALAAPMASPLFPSVSLENIDEDVLFILAQEDLSILELGNNLIRSNAQELGEQAMLLEIADMGHFSHLDILGLDPSLQPGCGEDERQTNGEPFTFLAPDRARTLVSEYTLAFLLDHFGEFSEAANLLSGDFDPPEVFRP